MRPIVYPGTALPLTHSWPLFERDQRFELGSIMEADALSADLSLPEWMDDIGRWECDLRSGALEWSPPVYDLFGLPRDARPVRAETVALYAEGSRAQMERLRTYAIRHRRGFTLDAELRPANGEVRWMRLIAAPVVENGRVVRLHGLKRDVTGQYP